MGVTDSSNARTPKRKDKVPGLFALANLLNCILVKSLIRVVPYVKLEKTVSPIVISIRNLEVLVVGHSHVFVADDIGFLVTIVYDVMPPGFHHLAKL